MFIEPVTRRARPPSGGPCCFELVKPSQTDIALLTEGAHGSALHL